ncbi:MAG: choice-of-anchor B family protein [Saprospiraceae bacterium]
MRQIFALIVLALPGLLVAQNINVTYQGKLTYANQSLANIWGYAAGGNEYALVGAKTGLSIVDVTDPTSPSEIVLIGGPSSDWREIKTYQHYAYVVSEGGGGVFIVDLTELPDPPPSSDYHNYNGDGAINGLLIKAHALHIDESAGYLYVYGSHLSNNSNQGKPLIFDLNADPYNPEYVGVYTPSFSPKYAHDGYADSDIMYSAHINAGKVAIVDMTDKSAPSTLATFTTTGAFTHNTWRNGNFLYTTDEISSSYLTAYDISDLDDIFEVDRIQSNPGSGSIVHNTYIYDDYAITSWYKDGFTIVDVSRPQNLIQIGNYDTYPNGQGNGFAGCWGVYPYLPSGNILASNIKKFNTNDGELWVLSPNYVRGCYLEGKITKASDGTPLSGARVEVLTTQINEPSNAAGLYKTGWHESGDYDVEVSKTGYQTWTGSVSLTNGVLTVLDVALLTAQAVEMLRFDAVLNDDDVHLSWATALERDNAGFEVQHSFGTTGNWQPLGFVSGKGDVDVLSEYQFEIQNLQPGKHFFRLRQIDFDGKANYTDVKTIQIRDLTFQADIFPNATSDRCTLHLFSEKPMDVTVEILDVTGYRMGLSWDFEIEHEMALPIDASILPAGIYYAHIITEIGDDVVVKWIKE